CERRALCVEGLTSGRNSGVADNHDDPPFLDGLDTATHWDCWHFTIDRKVQLLDSILHRKGPPFATALCRYCSRQFAAASTHRGKLISRQRPRSAASALTASTSNRSACRKVPSCLIRARSFTSAFAISS